MDENLNKHEWQDIDSNFDDLSILVIIRSRKLY